jgi:very-short-patch-repair endonuclease
VNAVIREKRIADLAVRQHGVVTRAQLLGLGISPAAIGRRLRSGQLRALHSGVYVVGPIQSARAHELAAVLAGGPEAWLSHTSALHVWKLLPIDAPRPAHVSVPANRCRSRPGVVFHRVAPLADDEWTVLDGIPITTPARTLVDVAGLLGSRELELALATAEREGMVGGEELARLPERYRGRPGITMFRALIGQQTGPHFSESEAERECRALLRRAGLPQPHGNVIVGPYRLDFFWPDEGVAIEVDGRAYHSSSSRFEADRRKDNWLRVRGIEVIRLTWRQITRDAVATAVLVGQTLALARARRQAAATRLPGDTVLQGDSGPVQPEPSLAVAGAGARPARAEGRRVRT